MWDIIYDFGLKFLQTIGKLWEWLITPFDILNIVQVAPIYIITGGFIISGLLRRLL